MENDLIDVFFYVPDGVRNVSNKKEIVYHLANKIEEDDRLSISGHIEKKDLIEGLHNSMGGGDVPNHVKLPDVQMYQLQDTINTLTDEIHKKLPIPTKNFLFLFPYFPGEEEKEMEGVMGVARYSCVFHMFISPTEFTYTAFRETFVHEFNHTIYYYLHFDRFGTFTLFDHCIMEGLAEHFREDVVGGTGSPWAHALTEPEAMAVLKQIENDLDIVDDTYREQLMFGGETFKTWTGYSIGYWLVHRARKEHPQMPWKELMKKRKEFYIQT